MSPGDVAITVVLLWLTVFIATVACVVGLALVYWVRDLVAHRKRARRRQARQVRELNALWDLPPTDGRGIVR